MIMEKEMMVIMQKIKSDVRITYPSSAGNLVMEILLLLFMAAGLFFNIQLVSRNIRMIFWVIFGLLWGINVLRFYKNTGVGVVKCCSLQLILCGLLGAMLIFFWNQYLPYSIYQSDIITVILLAVMVGCNFYCYQEKQTVYYTTFLIYPYCVLSADFILITGFFSTILLLMAFINGSLVFTNARMDDDEYFGNKNH